MADPNVVAGPYAVGSFAVDIAVDGDDHVWVANRDSDDVTELAPDGSLVATYAVGDAPQKLVVAPDGGVWVVCSGSDAVYRPEPRHGRPPRSGTRSPRGATPIWTVEDSEMSLTQTPSTAFSSTTRVRRRWPRG